jgi:hypothetical protein
MLIYFILFYFIYFRLGFSAQEYEIIKTDMYNILLLSATDMVRWAIDCCPEAIEDEVSVSLPK